MDLILNHCRVTAYYKERVHTFKDVNAAIHYDSKDRIDIDFSTGNWAEPWKGAVSIFKDRWI